MGDVIRGILCYNPERINEDTLRYARKLLDDRGASYHVEPNLLEEELDGFVFRTEFRLFSGLRQLVSLVCHWDSEHSEKKR